MSFLVAANVADMLTEPSSAAEVVSQTVLGASVMVTEESDDWKRITTEDNYTGWIRASLLSHIWDDGDHFKTSIATLFAEVFPQPDSTGEMMTKLVVGSRVAVAHRPEVDDWVPLELPDRRIGYVHKYCLNMSHDGTLAGPDLLDEKARRAISISDLKRQVLLAVGKQAIAIAKRLIGTPICGWNDAVRPRLFRPHSACL